MSVNRFFLGLVYVLRWRLVYAVSSSANTKPNHRPQPRGASASTWRWFCIHPFEESLGWS